MLSNYHNFDSDFDFDYGYDINNLRLFPKCTFLDRFTSKCQAIKLNLTENTKNYTMIVELPGVNKEEINLNVDNNTVNISVEKKQTTVDKNESMVYSDIKCGKFSRSVHLEKPVDGANIKAVYYNGLLNITIPKTNITAQTIDII